MTPTADLEARLRTGLRAAADDLPPADLARTPARLPAPHGRSGPVASRRVAVAAAIVGAMALAAATVAVVAVVHDDGPADDIRIGPVDEPPVTGYPAPGAAVVDGSEILTFDEHGERTGQISIAPLEQALEILPDLHGGWIVCGSQGFDVPVDLNDLPAGPPEERGPSTFRFRAGAEPELIADFDCGLVDMAVTPIAGRDIAIGVIYKPAPNDPLAEVGHMEMVDLATGEVLPNTLFKYPDLFSKWSAVNGRLAEWKDGALTLWDLATGAQLPAASPTLAGGQHVVEIDLSPDGTRVATVTGEYDAGTSELVVADVATGADVLRLPLDLDINEVQLTLGDTTVAVGGFDEPPITVYDLATGEPSRRIDVHGLFP